MISRPEKAYLFYFMVIHSKKFILFFLFLLWIKSAKKNSETFSLFFVLLVLCISIFLQAANDLKKFIVEVRNKRRQFIDPSIY